MAIYEMTARSRFAGQECINRWHYVSTGTPAAVQGSFGLVYSAGWVKDGLPAAFPTNGLFNVMRAVQSEQVAYWEVEVRNLYDPLDFYVLPLPSDAVGGVAGESMSPTQAWGFFSNRVRADVKRGMKRLVGVTEANVTNGGLVAAGIVPSLENVAGRFSAVLLYDDEGNALTYTPAVLSYEPYTPSPGRKAYRPYATESEQLDHAAIGVTYSPYTQIRTQVSRQYGRGR